jgi:hypothetical protein
MSAPQAWEAQVIVCRAIDRIEVAGGLPQVWQRFATKWAIGPRKP